MFHVSTRNVMDPKVIENNFMGMLVGHNLGDALGAPFEFTKTLQYTGRLIHEVKVKTRYQGTKTFPVGSVTDDTGMTLALLNSIIRQGMKYDVKDVCMSYIIWSNEWKLGQGKNTRALFCHPYKRDGFKNYIEAYNEIFCSKSHDTWTQSNGSLMRCSPLCMFSTLDWFQIDARHSNPHMVNQDCNIVYGYALWLAVRGVKRNIIWERIRIAPQTQELKDLIIIIENKQPYNISGKGVKGHVMRAFYCSMLSLRPKPDGSYPKYREIVDLLACIPDTDTDTNAAIAGALIGALDGYEALISDPITKENIEIIMRVNGIDYQKYRDILFSRNGSI